MVKGVRLCFLAAIFYVAVICLAKCTSLERQIKKNVYNNNGQGSYSFEFETIDGTFRKEDGGLIFNNNGGHRFFVRGEYGYIDPDGRPHLVRYVADANGYQPQTEDDVRYNDRRII